MRPASHRCSSMRFKRETVRSFVKNPCSVVLAGRRGIKAEISEIPRLRSSGTRDFSRENGGNSDDWESWCQALTFSKVHFHRGLRCTVEINLVREVVSISPGS